MKTKLSAALLLAVMFCAVSRANAQSDAVDLLSKAALQYAQGYINPLGNMFSAVFNSGQFHTADASGFHVYASVQMTGAIIPQSEKTFSPSFDIVTGATSDLPNTTLHVHLNNAPTILGGQANNMFLIDTIINNKHYQLGQAPPGINQNYIPLLVPHVEIGTFFNTELILRGIPSVSTNSSIGNINFYGIGLRHNLTGFIPVLPVDISVQLMYQHLGVGNIAAVDALNGAVLASIDLPVVTLYGGVQLERATFHAAYDFADSTLGVQQHVDLSSTSTNNVRFTIGATMKLLILYINAQATIAPISTIGLGVGVRLPPSIL